MSVVNGQLTLAQDTDLTFTEGDGTSDAAMKITGTGQRECGPGHGELSGERQLHRCRQESEVLPARRKLPTVDGAYVLVIGYFRVRGRDVFGLGSANSD